jgi:hypothetical protein
VIEILNDVRKQIAADPPEQAGPYGRRGCFHPFG